MFIFVFLCFLWVSFLCLDLTENDVVQFLCSSPRYESPASSGRFEPIDSVLLFPSNSFHFGWILVLMGLLLVHFFFFDLLMSLCLRSFISQVRCNPSLFVLFSFIFVEFFSFLFVVRGFRALYLLFFLVLWLV